MTIIALKYNFTVFLKSCLCSSFFTLIFILLIKLFEVKIFITNIPLICFTGFFIFLSGVLSSIVSIYGIHKKNTSKTRENPNNILPETIDQPLQDVKTFNKKLKDIRHVIGNNKYQEKIEDNNTQTSDNNKDSNSKNSNSSQNKEILTSHKLRIFNLPLNTSDNTIKQFFNNFDLKFNKISVIKNDKKKKTSFAIIEFESSEIDKNKILQELNSLNYAGKKLSAKFI